MKILLVDDEKINILILQKNIKNIRHDATFITAHNGDEAVDLAKKHQPDVIFLDDQMPEPQGCQACLAIRSDEEMPEAGGKRAFIVTYSGSYANEDYPVGDPRRGIYPGADAAHPKKVDLDKLATLFNTDYPAWQERQGLATKAAEPTTPTAGAGGGTGEAVPPLVPHDALTAAVTGEAGRLAMSPPSKPLALVHTPFNGRFGEYRLGKSSAPTDAPSLRRSLAATGHQSLFGRRYDERSLSPSKRAPLLSEAPKARLPRSATSSPMMLFDKKKTLAAPLGAPAPTAPESTTLVEDRVARA